MKSSVNEQGPGTNCGAVAVVVGMGVGPPASGGATVEVDVGIGTVPVEVGTGTVPVDVGMTVGSGGAVPVVLGTGCVGSVVDVGTEFVNASPPPTWFVAHSASSVSDAPQLDATQSSTSELIEADGARRVECTLPAMRRRIE